MAAKGGDDIDEVEQLIQSAQDELLLKLSVNSHMSRVSDDYLHPDLHRRFQALRSRPSQTVSSDSKSRIKHQQHEEKIDEDDLLTRFAALKASLPSSSSAVTVSSFETATGADEDDEVEKLIQWAIDAARLDPSLPSDDEDLTVTDDDSSQDADSPKKTGS